VSRPASRPARAFARRPARVHLLRYRQIPQTGQTPVVLIVGPQRGQPLAVRNGIALLQGDGFGEAEQPGDRGFSGGAHDVAPGRVNILAALSAAPM
jgi:hypothetical protein